MKGAVLLAMILGECIVSAQPAPALRPEEQQSVFFSGQVTLQDGSAPPDRVLIQKVCKGIAENETYTDSKGRFNFKVSAGASETAVQDSSQGTRAPDLSRPYGNSTYYSNPLTSALRDCEVKAVLAGFWAERVSIALKNTLDDTRVGTIILHPVAGQGFAVSATTLAAPSNARKAYEKGQQAIAQQHWDAAQKELKKAVEIYPKFAAAWFELGVANDGRKDFSSAEQAWKESLNADPKYVRPYEMLAAMAERKQDWTASEKYSREWIKLDPEAFPAAYLYNAVANAQLNHPDAAEAAARKGILLDKDKKIPRLNYVLGLLLMAKHEFPESVKCLKAYLEMAPNAKDAPIVAEQIGKMEASAKQ